MQCFLGEDFLLHSKTASRLYHTYAEKEPIFDFHCHLSPKEIWEDKRFETITEVWLSGDHYKWRLMRACGIPEEYITGNADPYEKFLKWAETVERCVGNPLYVWTHMELKNFFGISTLLNRQTAPEIWKACNQKLQEPGFSARGLIKQSGVAALCTTDDPADDLSYHQKLRDDSTFPVKVLPAFRPEVALHPENKGFSQWIQRLSAVSGCEITNLEQLEKALGIRAAFFKEQVCLIADQSLLSPDFSQNDPAMAEKTFQKACRGEILTAAELNAYQSEMTVRLGKLYHEVGFVMQLHFGVLRNCSSRMFPIAGPDTGFDSVGDGISAASVAALFDRLDSTSQLPPTVIYSLNGGDDDKLASVLGCFQEGMFPQKMQLGAPWWFSDHRDGMMKMMKALANTGLLSGFIGMLTDSRSFLSYARHEYFRRVLCDLFGTWMEDGDIPDDMDMMGKIISRICYKNAADYFHLEV